MLISHVRVRKSLKKLDHYQFSDKLDQFQCGSCNATHCGKTKRHFKVRMCEHLGISAVTGKRVKGDDDSAIKEHLLFCNHTPDLQFLLPTTTTLKLR